MLPMLPILAIDTATENCSAALLTADKLYATDKIAPQQHGKLILPMVKNLLMQANLALPDIKVIAFGAGPGSFTGTRIATSTAQGLAVGIGCKLIPVASLQTLAQQAYINNHECHTVFAAIDARMQEIYWGVFVLQNDIMQLQDEIKVTKPAKIILNKNMNYFGIGSGCVAYKDVLQNNHNNLIINAASDDFPLAATVAQLAALNIAASIAPETAVPLYIRNKIV